MAPLSILYTSALILSVISDIHAHAHAGRSTLHDYRRHWKRSLDLSRVRDLHDSKDSSERPTPTIPIPSLSAESHEQHGKEARDWAWSTSWSWPLGGGGGVQGGISTGSATSWSTQWGGGGGAGQGGNQPTGSATSWSTQWGGGGGGEQATSPAADTAVGTVAPSTGISYGNHGDWTTMWTNSGSSTGTPDAASTSTAGDGTHGSAASDAAVQAYVDTHNDVRAKYGACQLQWNNTLAAAAQEWSNKCNFEHSNGTLGAYGENLAAATGDYNIATAIDNWAAESKDYDPSNPQYSHFTQMIWKQSTQIGCALAQCDGIFPASYGKASFYTCEYYPQGNVIGQFSENVQV